VISQNVTAKVFSMTCCCQQVRKNFAVHVSLSVFNFQIAWLNRTKNIDPSFSDLHFSVREERDLGGASGVAVGVGGL
jgi:hypothetical protein